MFTGKEPHEISAEKAKELIKKWRDSKAKDEIRGGFFGRAILDKMLAQAGVVGLRIYHAKHEKGGDTLVVVGTDADGRDRWQGTIAEELRPCPPNCDPDPL